MTFVKRIFCETRGSTVTFSKESAARSLVSAENYLEMPVPLHRLYEFAFDQLPGWELKLCGLSKMGSRDEKFGMLVYTTTDVPSHTISDLLSLDMGIKDLSVENVTTLFIPADIPNRALAATLFLLHTLCPIQEFAEATYEADPPVGAEEKWYEIERADGIPRAFGPGISMGNTPCGVIYIRFVWAGREMPVVQQEGWHKWVPGTEQEGRNLTIKLASSVLTDKFDSNPVFMSRFLRMRLAELSSQAKARDERIPWRNLVLRLFSSEFPGFWDTAELNRNVSFLLEVGKNV